MPALARAGREWALALNETQLNPTVSQVLTFTGGIVCSLASGKCFSITTNGAQLDLGTGANDWLDSDGTRIRTGGELNVQGQLYAQNLQRGGTAPLTLTGTQGDSGSSVGIIIDLLNSYVTTGAKLVSFRNAGAEKASLSFDGYLASITPDTLTSVWVNANTTGLKGGHKLPARAFTVTGLSYLDTVASVGAGSAVWTITDGTNTCTATVTCAADAANSANRVATANGAGTGCVYAASAALTLTLTTAGCATTQETFANVDIEGKWQ